MKIKYLIYTFVIVALISSCKKDKVTHDPVITDAGAKISGYIYYDKNNDGLKDGIIENSEVFYGDSLSIYDYISGYVDTLGDVLLTHSDDKGYYEYVGIPPSKGKAIIINPGDDYHNISGTDITPDGDFGETMNLDRINISIDEDEYDDGNNFIAEFNSASISGTVFIDINGDGIKNKPLDKCWVLYGDSLDLYYFGYHFFKHPADSLWIPHDSLDLKDIKYTVTNSDGYYHFNGLKPSFGKAIIILPPLKNNGISGTDNKPDGDPEETLHLDRINIGLTEGEHDEGNDFTVKYYENYINGSVLIDTDMDMIGDTAPAKDFYVFLHRRYNDKINDHILEKTICNENGEFKFNNLQPGQYVLAINNPLYTILSGEDRTPDPDGYNPSIRPGWIFVDLEVTENDDDNEFVIAVKKPSIQGFILEDTNGDLVGDLPVSNQRVALHYRDLSGVPLGSTPYAAVNSNLNGKFTFYNVEPGKYVLYFLGDGKYNLLKSEDVSPEPGEVFNPSNIQFIPVNLTSSNPNDYGNMYIVKKK